MTISYRKLIQWRKEALRAKVIMESHPIPRDEVWTDFHIILERLLTLTQSLLDEHLLKK